MKIETKSLSKDTLAKIVEFMRPHPVTDGGIAALLHIEMRIEACKIPAKQEMVEKKINAMPVTFRSSQKRIKAHNDLVDKHNRLGARGRKLLKSIEEIEKEYPALKKGGTT